MDDKELIRFDWAMKRLLRDKANFGVLEGLITTLLGIPIKIRKLLESESNKETAEDKQNRVDLLAEDEKGALYIIEVQNETEQSYFQRMLFGTSKLITEYINSGEGYEEVKKVYSINIVYFKLGYGTDYVYHGKTEFRGIHDDDILSLSPFQQQKFDAKVVSDLYPEYFILKANDFNRWSKMPLDQWLYFLSTGRIPSDATAPGLDEARDKLRLIKMNREELSAYKRHMNTTVILRDNINSAWEEGEFEGRKAGLIQGLQQGAQQERLNIARNMKANGLDSASIAKMTGLSPEVINTL